MKLRIADCGFVITECEYVEMDPGEFKKRTEVFAIRVIRLVEALPKSRTTETLGRQLLKSGTSVGANYRAACRAKSKADLVAKMGIVEEECDESAYWMEILVELGLVNEKLIAGLRAEADEILSMTVSSIKTARLHK